MDPQDQNLLLSEIRYKETRTGFGTWKRFVYPTGQGYAEFTSHRRMFGLPLLHYTSGRNPETGSRKVARGIFAVGRIAAGVFPLGQLSIGLVPVGQAAIGCLALGQGAAGIVALGQISLAVLFAAGQIAVGSIAIGQIALGNYILAQTGIGKHVWSVKVKDPEAIRFFLALKDAFFR